jgi:hypothetical protein
MNLGKLRITEYNNDDRGHYFIAESPFGMLPLQSPKTMEQARQQAVQAYRAALNEELTRLKAANGEML